MSCCQLGACPSPAATAGWPGQAPTPLCPSSSPGSSAPSPSCLSPGPGELAPASSRMAEPCALPKSLTPPGPARRTHLPAAWLRGQGKLGALCAFSCEAWALEFFLAALAPWGREGCRSPEALVFPSWRCAFGCPRCWFPPLHARAQGAPDPSCSPQGCSDRQPGYLVWCLPSLCPAVGGAAQGLPCCVVSPPPSRLPRPRLASVAFEK